MATSSSGCATNGNPGASSVERTPPPPNRRGPARQFQLVAERPSGILPERLRRRAIASSCKSNHETTSTSPTPQIDLQHCAKCKIRHRLEHCPEFSSLDYQTAWISLHRTTCASHASGPDTRLVAASNESYAESRAAEGTPAVPRSPTGSRGLPRPSRYARRSCSLRGNPSLPPCLGWQPRPR